MQKEKSYSPDLYSQLLSLKSVVEAYEAKENYKHHAVKHIIKRALVFAVIGFFVLIFINSIQQQQYLSGQMSDAERIQIEAWMNENLGSLIAAVCVVVPLLLGTIGFAIKVNALDAKANQVKKDQKDKYPDLLKIDAKYVNSRALNHMISDLNTDRANTLPELLDRYDDYVFKNHISNSIEQIRRNSYWWWY